MRKALDAAEKAYKESQQQHEATSIELKKLARIRRVHASVRRKGELEQEITAVGNVVRAARECCCTLGRSREA